MLRITIMNRAFCCAVIFIVFFVQGYACRAADARWDSDSVSAGRVGEDPNAWVQACSPCESNQAEVQISALSRSEEHTSELQSLMRISYAVFCLKKKNIIEYIYQI